MTPIRGLVILVAFAFGAGVGWLANGRGPDGDRPATHAKLESELETARQVSARLREELEIARMEQAAAEGGAAQATPDPAAASPDASETDEERDEKRAAAKRKLTDLEYRLSADPTNPTLLADYIRTAAQAGEPDTAIDRIKALVDKHPDNADLITSLGQAYLGKIGSVEEPIEKGRLAFTALGEFSKALGKDESHFDARWYRAVLQYHMPPFLGKLGGSIKDLETMVEQSGGTGGDERYARVYTLLGRAYRKAGRTEDAKKTIDAGLAIFPDDARLKREAGE